MFVGSCGRGTAGSRVPVMVRRPAVPFLVCTSLGGQRFFGTSLAAAGGTVVPLLPVVLTVSAGIARVAAAGRA